MNVIVAKLLADSPAERLSTFEALALWPKPVVEEKTELSSISSRKDEHEELRYFMTPWTRKRQYFV